MKAIIGELAACAIVQRTYGKQGEDLEVAAKIWSKDLQGWAGEDIAEAMEYWRMKSQEFPTPADIIAILERQPKMDGAVYREFLNRRKNGDVLTQSQKNYIENYERTTMKGL